METRIKKMRERLERQRLKIAELEAQAAEMEQEIKKAEEEQLGYLARFAANNLSGGIDEVFEMLRSLQMKPHANGQTSAAASGVNITRATNTADTGAATSTANADAVDSNANATHPNTATPYNHKNYDENKEGETDYDGNGIEASNESE